MENAPESKLPTSQSHQFHIDVDHVKYYVQAMPFTFNDQVRYKVVINDTPAHIFVWDEALTTYRPIDDESAVVPDGLIKAINQKLMDQVQIKSKD